MKFKSTVNHYRREIMRSLTGLLMYTPNKPIAIDKREVRRILVSRPNSRLGNQLLTTPVVQELSVMFPNAKIDLFVRGPLSFILFENYDRVDRIIDLPKKPFKNLIKYFKVWISLRKHPYDLVVNVAESSSSGRLSTRFARARVKFINQDNEELHRLLPDYMHTAKNLVYNLRNCFDKDQLRNTVAPLDLKLSNKEKDQGKQLLFELTGNHKPTIGIYTFATGGKCYSKEWWSATYERLKEEYAQNYNILEILPIENVSQIDFKALNFYSKDIREIASLIAGSAIFVGADSGMMHLASASGAPTLGLFSVTKADNYQPYGKSNCAVDTSQADLDTLIRTIDGMLQTESSGSESYQKEEARNKPVEVFSYSF